MRNQLIGAYRCNKKKKIRFRISQRISRNIFSIAFRNFKSKKFYRIRKQSEQNVSKFSNERKLTSNVPQMRTTREIFFLTKAIENFIMKIKRQKNGSANAKDVSDMYQYVEFYLQNTPLNDSQIKV